MEDDKFNNVLQLTPRTKPVEGQFPKGVTVWCCQCGNQTFWVRADGFIECTGCHKTTPTIEVF